jgi:hypothetical protein
LGAVTAVEITIVKENCFQIGNHDEICKILDNTLQNSMQQFGYVVYTKTLCHCKRIPSSNYAQVFTRPKVPYNNNNNLRHHKTYYLLPFVRKQPPAVYLLRTLHVPG